MCDIFLEAPFYLIHLRKTGGTSLNNMFLSLATDAPSSLYDRLSKEHSVECNGYKFVAWDASRLGRADFFYGFSHNPIYHLNFKAPVSTITCFRDPVSRVVSLYKMLKSYEINNISHPGMKTQKQWLGSCFEDFLYNIPKKELFHQIYMFSADMLIQEALVRIKDVSHVIMTERFSSGVEALNAKTGLKLQARHMRRSDIDFDIQQRARLKLERLLEPEYELLEQVKKLPNMGVY